MQQSPSQAADTQLQYNSMLGVYLFLSAAVDVAITSTLILVLRKHIAGFNLHTDDVLRSLINIAAQTALYTTGERRARAVISRNRGS